MNQELSVYKNIIDGVLELKLTGFVTAANAGKILEAVNGEASPFQNVTIDAGELAYVSSAGLRQLVQLITIAESRRGGFGKAACIRNLPGETGTFISPAPRFPGKKGVLLISSAQKERIPQWSPARLPWSHVGCRHFCRLLFLNRYSPPPASPDSRHR